MTVEVAGFKPAIHGHSRELLQELLEIQETWRASEVRGAMCSLLTKCVLVRYILSGDKPEGNLGPNKSSKTDLYPKPYAMFKSIGIEQTCNT